MHSPREVSCISEIVRASDSIVMLKSRFSPPMPVRRPIKVVRACPGPDTATVKVKLVRTAFAGHSRGQTNLAPGRLLVVDHPSHVPWVATAQSEGCTGPRARTAGPNYARACHCRGCTEWRAADGGGFGWGAPLGPWYSGGGATWGIAAAAVGLRRIVPNVPLFSP